MYVCVAWLLQVCICTYIYMHICTHIVSLVLKPHNIIFTCDKILIEIPSEFNMSTVDKLYVYVSAMSFTSSEMVAADQKWEASDQMPRQQAQ